MGKLVRTVIVVAFIATACKAEIGLNVVVNDDGSGTYEPEFGIDDELKGIIELTSDGQDPMEFLRSVIQLPDDLSFVESTEGVMTFFRSPFTFASIEELNDIAAASPGGLIDSFTFSLDEELETADLQARVTFPDLTAGFRNSPIPIDPSVLSDDLLAIRVRVTMPGSVTSSNAARTLESGALEWDVPPTGGSVTMEAQSSTAGDGVPWRAFGYGLIGVAGLGAAGLIAVAARRSRKARQVAVGGPTDTAEPITPEPWSISDEAPDVAETAGDFAGEAPRPDDFAPPEA